MNWFVKQLSQPSTGAGLGIIAYILSGFPKLAPYASILQNLALIGGGHAVVMQEQK